MTKEAVIAVIFAIVFASIGIVLWRWPRDIRDWYVSKYENVWTGLAAWNPLLDFMKLDEYIIMLKVIAVFSWLASFVVLFAVLT